MQKLTNISQKSTYSKFEGVVKNNDHLFDYCNIWPLRKKDKEDSLSSIFLKVSVCVWGGGGGGGWWMCVCRYAFVGMDVEGPII